MEEACQGGVILEEKSDHEGWVDESPYMEEQGLMATWRLMV